jgi:hypothetical protein
MVIGFFDTKLGVYFWIVLICLGVVVVELFELVVEFLDGVFLFEGAGWETFKHILI